MTPSRTYTLPHPLVSATFIIAFGFFLNFTPPLFSDPDTPWHLAAGNLIRAIHMIPAKDTWSYTAGNTPWYNLSWLWDLLLSFVLARVGELGLFAFCCGLQALFLSLLAVALMERPRIHEDALKVALLMVGYVLMTSAPGRPQMATYIFSVLYAMLLHRSRSDHSYKNLLWLPMIMAFWVNMHGGFITGFSVLGAYVIEAYQHKRRAWLQRLILIGVVCGAMTLLNPYGWKIIIAVLRSLDSVVYPYISEWHPFMYGQFFGITIFTLVFILTSNSANKEIPLADKIITFIWMIAAFSQIRNFIIFALLAAPYMAINMVGLMVVKDHPDISGVTYRWRVAAFTVICTVILCIAPVQRFLKIDPLTNAETKVPTDAIDFIDKNYPSTRFWNDYSMGGNLIYYYVDLSKKRLISIDSRAGTAYSEAFLTDMLKLHTMDKGWEDVLDKYQAGGLIVYNNSAFAENYDKYHFTSKWKKVFTGKVASVYIR